MACYVEEEVWKCPKHPSKRRRNGICPACLRDRLAGLCPHCANVRPCACSTSSSSSSTSSSSFSRVIDGEPPLHRSRSLAVKTPSFLSTLRRSKTKRCDQAAAAAERGEGFVGGENNFDNSNNRIEDFARLITRSRSVSVGTTAAVTSGFRRSKDNSSPSKGKFWHFPSPMTVFRSSKSTKVIGQDRSPLHRG